MDIKFRGKIRGKDKWDAFITWDTLDMFNLANTEKEAKDNLFRRINTGWQDPIYENQEHD